MQNLTLNIAQYQTFNVQYCKSLLYSHLNDNKLKILIQYSYLLVSYAFDENYINMEFLKMVCLLIKVSTDTILAESGVISQTETATTVTPTHGISKHNHH